MAIVADKGNMANPVDKPLSTHNRKVSADPNGSLTPEFNGEIVLDTDSEVLWQAQDLTNSGWVVVTEVI